MTTSRLRHGVKVLLACALYYSGALFVWQRVALRQRAVVLMYHRVLSEDERRRTGSHPGIVVDAATFARHMALLERRFTVLTIEQFIDHLSRGIPFADSSCLITFDDGWKDNLKAAVPVLRRYGFPSLIFLPVNFIGEQRMFWREALTHLLVEAVDQASRDAAVRSRLTTILDPLGLTKVLVDSRQDPHARVIAAVAAAPGLRRRSAAQLIGQLETAVGVKVDPTQTPDGFLTWDDARDMANAGVRFGGHGAEHLRLGEIPPDEADVEIRTARAVVESRSVAAVPAFSYPNGSFNEKVVDLVQSAGFKVAFTTKEGSVASSDHPLTLARINMHEGATASTPLLMARLVGLF